VGAGFEGGIGVCVWTNVAVEVGLGDDVGGRGVLVVIGDRTAVGDALGITLGTGVAVGAALKASVGLAVSTGEGIRTESAGVCEAKSGATALPSVCAGSADDFSRQGRQDQP
jgi:hypothetical protein